MEVTLSRTTWLGEAGAKLRGYFNAQWQFQPVGAWAGCVADAERRFHVVSVSRAVGSRLHVHFAAQPELLRGFFRGRVHRPHPTDPWALVPSTPWGLVS